MQRGKTGKVAWSICIKRAPPLNIWCFFHCITICFSFTKKTDRTNERSIGDVGSIYNSKQATKKTRAKRAEKKCRFEDTLLMFNLRICNEELFTSVILDPLKEKGRVWPMGSTGLIRCERNKFRVVSHELGLCVKTCFRMHATLCNLWGVVLHHVEAASRSVFTSLYQINGR